MLYAEDDADDKAWINEAWEVVNPRFAISFVGDGKELLKYILPLSQDQLPALIVLDLNMPQMDGRQTLQKLKENLLYQHIPVVIVTTSSNKVDREICERLGAALFLIKPSSRDGWKTIIHELNAFAF